MATEIYLIYMPFSYQYTSPDKDDDHISIFSYPDGLVTACIPNIQYRIVVLPKTHRYKSHLQIKRPDELPHASVPPLFTYIHIVQLSYQITHKASPSTRNY
jgi:hypothetical protein